MKKKITPYNIDENGRVLITEEELEESKELAFKEYGVKLTDKQAFVQGFALTNLFDQMVKRLSRNKQLNKYE